ncbi:MAG TPA: DUF3306 domain-containing protein [Stellaceae bacterium]|jgi:hypothetical protein|nr:DUF3306 domain-containing protein [Stellaceae bacterium]
MSADESFLARWSRRKRAAADRERPPARATEDNGGGATAATDSGPEPAPSIDLASLPPVESIGAGSDIRAFLAPGVPAELMRAALRRAWSADPAIRDFIGLSENSWDFNAPGGVPGFGPVTAEDVERLLARLSGEPAADEAPTPVGDASSRDQIIVTDADSADHAPAQQSVEPQHASAKVPPRAPQQRRRHGGALPE